MGKLLGRTVGGSGLMVLSRWPIVEADTHDFSFHGMLHQLKTMESWAQGSVGLAKIETENGFKINAYITHLMDADPSQK